MGADEQLTMVEHAINAYTGSSPATFFTFLEVLVAFYYVSLWSYCRHRCSSKRSLRRSSELMKAPIRRSPSSWPSKAKSYVAQSRMFYGPGGPYALFTGKDASRALAKMSFKQKDLNGYISSLGSFELKALQDWEYRFMRKYVKVGTSKKTVQVRDDSSSAVTYQTTDLANQISEGSSPTDVPREAVQDAELSNRSPVNNHAETLDHDAGAGAEKHTEPKESCRVYLYNRRGSVLPFKELAW